MRKGSVWRRLLGVDDLIVEDAGFEGEDLVVRVRLYKRQRGCCSRCGRSDPEYDAGDGRRRWRSLELGTVQTFIEAEAPRVECPEHGVVVARVPWADHDSRFTVAFEDQAAWLAVECSTTAVSLLMRTSWRTVVRVLVRVARRLQKGHDRLDGLRRIGIDEISCKKRHRYLVVVVDHDRKCLVWAAEGRTEETLDRFFYELGPERCALITHVSADAAAWVENAVECRCPQAIRCLDSFHVVARGTEAIDQIRRELWDQARDAGLAEHDRRIKRTRWALGKNPEDLTERQRSKLTWLEKLNHPLYHGYLLKESLRLIFQLPAEESLELSRELAAVGLITRGRYWLPQCQAVHRPRHAHLR